MLLDIQAQANNPELSNLMDSPESEDNKMYFAGILQTGPPNHMLPQNAKEAFKGPDNKCWKPALQEELQNLIDNNVFEVVPTPKGVKPITSKLVFCVKYDTSREVECYKVWIVA